MGANQQMFLGVKPAAGGGGTAQITVSAATYDLVYMNRNTDSAWAASKIVPASSYTINRVDIPVFKTGSPTFSCTVSIYTDSAGAPGTLVGTASAAVSASGAPGTEGASTSYTGISAAVTSGVSYWVVLHKSTGTDGYFTDFLNWNFINGGAGSTYKMMQSTDGITWADAANYIGGFDMPGKLVVYS